MGIQQTTQSTEQTQQPNTRNLPVRAEYTIHLPLYPDEFLEMIEKLCFYNSITLMFNGEDGYRAAREIEQICEQRLKEMNDQFNVTN
jgi:hypothetical protein